MIRLTDVALSPVTLQIGSAIADTLGQCDAATNPAGLTNAWPHDRSGMLHALAITRSGESAVGKTNIDHFDAASRLTVVQRVNGVGSAARTNDRSFLCAG